MPRLAANLSLLYPEHAFLDRFAAAAADGFTGVECQFPYDEPAADIAARLAAHGLQQVLINAPPGDWAAGERGLAALPGREDDFRRSLDQALGYAQALGCPRLHLMAGVVPPGAERARLLDTFTANLAWAAAHTAGVGLTLLIEPINPHDMPGYLLQRQDEAHALVQAVGAAHLLVQLDLYHCQRVEGDVATRLRQDLPAGRVGHLQIAGVPDRHEPDARNELDAPGLLAQVDALGWDGWVGCEYRPRLGAQPGGTRAGLAWRDALAGWR